MACDEHAVEVLRAMSEAGLRSPYDVAVVSFDGIPGAACSPPALTTVAQPFAAPGPTALAHLPAQQGGTLAPADVLPVAMARQGSCSCPDPPDGDVSVEGARV